MGILSAGGFFTGVEVQAGDATGKVHLNSPFIIFNFAALWSYLGMLIVTAIMLNVAIRDFQNGSFPLYFTKPVRKTDYLGGRFAGGFVTCLFIFSGIGLGILFGTALPILDPILIGPFRLIYFLNPYLIMVIPNLFILCGLFFSFSILTRKTLPVYSIAVVFLVGYLMAVNMMASLENRHLVSLLDPLGFTASMIAAIDYWTVAQKNTLTIPLEGAFLWNRVIWIGLTALFAGFSLIRFKFNQFLKDTSATRAIAAEDSIIECVSFKGSEKTNDESGDKHPGADRIKQSFAPWSQIKTLWHMVRYESLVIVKSVPFLVIILSAILFMAMNTKYIGYIYGTPGYPITYKVLQNLAGKFILFVLIIATFYAGELIWRTRDLKSSQIVDSMPVPGWMVYLSYISAIALVLGMLLPIIFITGICIQTVKGYYHYEIWLYITDLIVFNYPTYILLAAIAIAVQSIVSNKYMGHFLMILYYTITDFMEEFGFQHLLYSYARDPGKTYSDMNGYGPYLWPYIVLKSYWFVIAAMMLIIGYLFWPRGTELSLKARFKTAVIRWTPGLRTAFAVLLVTGSALAGYIFYNTNILNHYRTTHDEENLQVRYETSYKQYENLPQPRITDASIRVELYPDTRSMETTGTFIMRNRSESSIDIVYLTIPNNDIEVDKLALDRPFSPGITDKELGFFSLTVDRPIEPGEQVQLDFAVAFRPRGFPNSGMNNDFAANGTFINNKEYFPSIGYMSDLEISNDVRRRKLKLPSRPRMAPIGDPSEINRNYVSGDADWINYEAIIGTEPDQIAITCGHLQKEWTENGRRYFHYRMNRPMINFYPVLSARYAVMNDRWKNTDLAIYYHPTHTWNLDRMMDSMKKCMETYSSSFSPFQFDQLRIIEFPRYNAFAQSFANTIPYSESIGFVARITDDDVDYPFGITAHETAHQWWAHQVIGANVQGTTMLSEMLAQYGELLMAKQEFPDKIVRKYLQYELDNYLMLRSNEGEGELPMILNENQGYVHYQKSTIIMNQLIEAIGIPAVNTALSEFISDYAYEGPPYPRSIDLVPYFRKAAPQEYQKLITDLFEKVVLFDNKATEVTSEKLANGQYEVTITAVTRKFHVDGMGEEIDQPVDDWIEFGVLDLEGEPIQIERRLTSEDRVIVTMTVDREPGSAGIDPLKKLIDKRPADNTRKI